MVGNLPASELIFEHTLAVDVLTNCTWDEDGDVAASQAPLSLTKTGEFTSDILYAAGKTITVTGGLNATPGDYIIDRKISDDEIILTTSLGALADGDSDINISATTGDFTGGVETRIIAEEINFQIRVLNSSLSATTFDVEIQHSADQGATFIVWDDTTGLMANSATQIVGSSVGNLYVPFRVFIDNNVTAIADESADIQVWAGWRPNR